MKERFNETINSIIITSIITLIVGLIMIFLPKVSIDTLGIVAAVCIIAHGIVLVYIDIKASKYYVPFDGLFSGIISIFLGVLLLCKPSILPVIFTIVLGIWVILMSINYIKIAIKMRSTKLPWVEVLLLGILDLVAGLILIINPFEATISLVLFAGIMLIIHSVINIIDVLLLKKDVKEISKALDEQLKDLTK